MSPGFFTLGLYQIENLIMARPSFRFFDIRVRPQIVADARVQSILVHASVVRKSELMAYVENQHVRPDEPIILLCEDGRLSSTAATELEAAGFKQLYVVEGGLDGLLREATLS
jgi:rhodanese-related sulfurtransferase